MGGSDSELVVASVALLISVVALTATFMQVLQQYYASASGYSRCTEEVMGEWARSKTRRFSWEEMRFVVQFDTPVIFVSPPTNDKGPLHHEEIHFLDGSQDSRRRTFTREEHKAPGTENRREQSGITANMVISKDVKERVQTADHERASWLVLLFAVQRMEEESRQWQEKQYSHHRPPTQVAGKRRPRLVPPPLHDHHTLTVAVQRKRRSWDTMPSSLSRPYATTTMCHLIEMMAALGIYWKEFNHSRDLYRAEGNGFMVLGERMSHLGLVFSFQRYGRCRFKNNRVIPVDEVKELCFGYVPTIYREVFDARRLSAPSEIWNLGSLKMATRAEIAETLIVIGCNKNSVQYYLNDNSITTHLFPVFFEILGMLARTLHIDGTYFTYLPNPTSDQWERRSVSLAKTMESYRLFLDVSKNPNIRGRILRRINSILGMQDREDTSSRFLLFGALHEALDDADAVLTAKKVKTAKREYLTRPSLGSLDKAKTSSMGISSTSAPDIQRRRREVVQDVIWAHIQEILRLLNERDHRSQDATLVVAAGPQTASLTSSRPGDNQGECPSFAQLNEASPEERQHKFMQLYFEAVRPQVVPFAQESTRRREELGKTARSFRKDALMAEASHVLRKRSNSKQTGYRSQVDICTTEEVSRSHDLETTLSQPHGFGAIGDEGGDDVAEEKSFDEVSTDNDDEQCENDVSLADEPASHDDIWCVLIFRMICWLMLHDFDRQDIQVSKSELLGSRMPVHIG